MQARIRHFDALTVSHLTLFVWVAGSLGLTCLAQYLAKGTASEACSPVQFATDAAVVFGFGWSWFQITIQCPQNHARGRWVAAIGAMLLFGAIQFSDQFFSNGIIDDDWLIDMPMWAAVSSLVGAAISSRHRRPWAWRLWLAGSMAQCAFVILHLCWSRTTFAGMPSTTDIASLGEWSELLSIECYVAALVLLGTVDMPTSARRLAWPLPLGAEARRIYERAHLFRKPRYPPLRLAFVPGVLPVLLVGACLWLVLRVGPGVRKSSKRPLLGQLGDLLILTFRDGFDPLTYYLQDLYRPGGREEAAFYLTRYETKNGLLSVLNHMRPQPAVATEMKDKGVFAARCRQEGLAAVPTLLTCENAQLSMLASRDALDCDLFCKPIRGRGARGALMFLRTAHERYRAPDGTEVDLDTLLELLRVIGGTVPMLVQPRLVNHAEIADLAEQSLVTIRVLTCLDAADRPVATHGMLRILSKLEPRWGRKDEYASPIELDSGRLGLLVSDQLAGCSLRHTHHPITGRKVSGRVLSTWPAIKALAVSAHQAFPHRILVGWDIASTVDGPVLLEGNTNLDVMFPQRAYGEGFGRGPLGPLLERHLALLARQHGV
ncbi:MAG: sugar-transfer associated ATP-grasp domain-containing protein [Pseudomonadota bacterium]|nr:sugar-transfer associated ATP-grasp domain-containing protein [Pseudomonadota bacterium]